MKKNIFIILLPGLLLFSHIRVVGQTVKQSGFFSVSMDKGIPILNSKKPGDTVAGRIYFNLMNNALLNARSLRFECFQIMESGEDGKKCLHDQRHLSWQFNFS